MIKLKEVWQKCRLYPNLRKGWPAIVGFYSKKLSVLLNPKYQSCLSNNQTKLWYIKNTITFYGLFPEVYFMLYAQLKNEFETYAYEAEVIAVLVLSVCKKVRVMR